MEITFLMVADIEMVSSEERMADLKTNNTFDPDRCGNLTEDYTLVRYFFSSPKIQIVSSVKLTHLFCFIQQIGGNSLKLFGEVVKVLIKSHNSKQNFDF